MVAQRDNFWVHSFGKIYIRNSDPSSFRPWYIKWTNESLLRMDSSVLSDYGPLILISQKNTLLVFCLVYFPLFLIMNTWKYWLNKNGKKQHMFKCLWAKDVLLQNVQKAHVFAGWGVSLVFYVKSFHITWRWCMISNLFVITTKVSTQG